MDILVFQQGSDLGLSPQQGSVKCLLALIADRPGCVLLCRRHGNAEQIPPELKKLVPQAADTEVLDVTAAQLLQLLPLRKRMSVQCLQLLGVAVKAAACLGEGDLPGAAVKQLEPQLMLQLPDLLGQGRLGDVEGVCRSSKALLFSNG